MLELKAVKPYEVRVCSLTGELMFGGDWYYENEEGKIFLYEAYHTRKKEQKEKCFNYEQLIKAQSRAEYKEQLKQYERECLEENILS